MNIKSDEEKSRDVDEFFSRILASADKKKYKIDTLGIVGNDPIYFLRPELTETKPRVLIAGGFHGEEPAGSWGLLRFIEEADSKFFENCSISFLPLVNPTGIRQGRRQNDWGENPNAGFCHQFPSQSGPSKEGHILLGNLDLLKQHSRDGFISLHEDIDCVEYYIYTFENSEHPGKFSHRLRQAEEIFFNPMPNGMFEVGMINNGIIFNHCDGSFEDRLFHEGIPRTACTETPGKLEFKKRVEANTKIIEYFVDYHVEA